MLLRSVISLLMLMLLGSDALAKKRIALLIGNKGYKAGVGALRNPLNDIREALRIVGFEVPKPERISVLRSLKDQKWSSESTMHCRAGA